MTRFSYSVAPLVLLAIAGCTSHDSTTIASGTSSRESAPVAANDAERLLKKSMDMYKGLHSFRASYSWSDAFGPQTVTAKRTFSYEAPNTYHAVEIMAPNRATKAMTLTSISDGQKVVEYSSLAGMKAQNYPAPGNITGVSSMMMQHPMFEGTLLYKFFAGSDDYDALVDKSKAAPTFGTEVKEPNESAKHVKFYGTGIFGNTDALIGENSYKVYEISYDSRPLMERISQSNSAAGGKASTSKSVEKYSEINLNPTIASTEFAANLPAGMELANQASSTGADDKPPVPIGSKAPDFKVTPVDGGPEVSLSSLRGKAVLVDFWATWCGPCKMSLPHTQAIYNDLKSKGLQVLVVSNEEAPKIQAFIQQNKYTFPVYRDPGNSAELTYRVDAIPCVLIIDKEGKLQYDFVGLRDEATLRDALKHVGVD